MSVIEATTWNVESFGTGKFYKDPEDGGPPLVFKPEVDPLPTTSVFGEGEAGLPDKFRRLAAAIFGETEEKMVKLIVDLREAVEEEGLELPDNVHLHRKLLRAGNLEIQGTIKVLRSFLQMLNGYPLYFDHVLPFEKSNPVWDQRLFSSPPLRDQHGRRLFLMRVAPWNPDKVPFSQCFSVIYKILSVVALEPKSQIAGVTVVVDCGGFGYRHFRSLSFDDVRIISDFVQQGFPLWFRKIHICQAGRFFNMFFAVLKPFLSKEVKDNFSFHATLKDLHVEVPTEVLPKEFGGETGEFDHNDCKESTELFEDFFKEVRQLGVDNKGRC